MANFRGGDMEKTGLFLLSFAFSLCLLCSVASAKDLILKRFEGIYEPSGVVQLPEGRIVIIEDGKNVPLWVLELEEKDNEIILVVKQRIEIKGPSYDDLEGIEVGKDDELFLITSHSQGKSKRKKKRERLLKYRFSDGGTEAETGENIFSAVMASLGDTVDKKDSLNIEALSFDHKKETLLLGLRSPMDGDKAIILEMKNPGEYFAKTKLPVLKKRTSLPIKGGMRAMSFDSLAQRFILASEIEEEDGKQSALWSWDGVSQKVERLQIPGLKKAKNVEGVTTLRWRNKNYLLLVCDDGNKKKKKGAHYLIVPYQK
jgi:hypothetical protein